MSPYEVEHYYNRVTAFGQCGPGKAAQKVTRVLKLIEDLDIVPSSYLKKLAGTEEIWECRITFGSNA